MPPSPQSAIGNRHSALSRSLPHSLEAEMGVLGSILLDPKDVLPEVVAVVADQPDHFYTHSHKVIYEALRAMNIAGQAVDPVLITQRLKDGGKLDEAGGPLAVTNLFTSVPTAGNWQYYLNIVREKYLLRSLIDATGRISARCYDEPDAVEEIIDDAEKSVFAIADRGTADTSRLIKAVIPEVFTTIESLYNNRGSLTGLTTGFRDYDRLTSGLHPGEMTILAARPGVGKTAFALNMADAVVTTKIKDEGGRMKDEEGIGDTKNDPLPAQRPPSSFSAVALFSLEMSAESLVMRMMCARAQVDSHRVRSGQLSKADLTPLTNAAATLTQCPLHIDDCPSMGILQLRAKARRLKARHDIRLIIVDYLQLVTDSTIRKEDGRQAEVASVSRQLKALAKELHVPIVVLCQLNREIEKRGDNARPRLADLRESGSIEQDADVVAFLTRKDSDTENGEPRASNRLIEARLQIEKQRNGPTGDVPLMYRGDYTRFYDVARTEKEEG